MTTPDDPNFPSFQPAPAPPPPTPQYASPLPEDKLRYPAIGLMVSATICALGWALRGALFAGIGVIVGFSSNKPDDQLVGALFATAGTVLSIPGLILCAAIIWGAWKMMNMESYTMATVGAAIAVIPCASTGCFFLTLPFGIWALVVMNEPGIKASFRS